MEANNMTMDGLSFGRYVLFGELGGGQMIEVWAAGEVTSDNSRRSCVIKRVNPRYKNFEAPHSLLRKEVELLGRVSHPNLIQMYEHGKLDDLSFVAFELIDGVALCQLGHLVSSPMFPLGAVVELGQRIGDALNSAHQLTPALAHGRLSPSNIILGRSGEIRLADLALATATAEQASASLIPNAEQLGYFAPEQLANLKHSPVADIFALGVILVELSSGRRLFPEGTGIVEDQEALVRRMCAKSPTEEMPKSLVDLLVNMTCFDHTARTPSIAAFAEELRAIALANDLPGSIQDHLNHDVFVQLPQISQPPEALAVEEAKLRPDTQIDPVVPEMHGEDVRNALLGTARPPERRITTASSFPTTGAILLDQITYEQTLEFELPERLPSSALSPLVPVVEQEHDEPTVPPFIPPPRQESEEIQAGTYRILGQGFETLLAYEPYLRAINVLEAQVTELKDPQIYEFYLKLGDEVGPRVIKKNLTTRIYRDQEVVLLEGSDFYRDRVRDLIEDSMFLPKGIVSARGDSVMVDIGEEKAEEYFLSTHERRVPRPTLTPEPPNKTKERLFRFFKDWN